MEEIFWGEKLNWRYCRNTLLEAIFIFGIDEAFSQIGITIQNQIQEEELKILSVTVIQKLFKSFYSR